MKQILSVLWQTLVLFAAALAGFVVGLFKPSLRVTHVLSQTATDLRTYDFDWLIAAVLVYLLLLVLHAARGRLRQGGLAATIALLITVAGIVLFTHIGIQNTPR